MPVDLLFELEYLLSDLAGSPVKPRSYSYDAGSGELCIELAEPLEARVCVPLRQCRGLQGPKLERCIAKALAQEGPWTRSLQEQLQQLLESKG